MKNIIFLLVLNCPYFFGFSQSGQVGHWIDYLPYHNIKMAAASPKTVYGLSESGLIELNKEDNSVQLFSKVNGLSDINLSCIGYNAATNTFVVGYENGKIDLITNGKVTAVFDLYKKSISGNKRLNSVFMDGKYAYIATGFGIIKFDVERQEFTDTYLITTNGGNIFTNDVTIFKDTIYAATVNGIRKAYKNDNQISFYETWKIDTTLVNGLREVLTISSHTDRMFCVLPIDTALVDETYEYIDGIGWQLVSELENLEVRSIEVYDEFIMVSHEGDVIQYDYSWNQVDKIFTYGQGRFVNPNFSFMDNSVRYVADKIHGLVQSPKAFNFEVIDPASPPRKDVEGIEIKNNNIWIAAGGRENNYNNVYSNQGIYWRNNNEWGATNKFIDTVLRDVFDIIAVKNHPFNSNITYGGSLGGGLIEFTNNNVSEIFNSSNSSLMKASGVDWVGVTDMAFDGQGNLWIANSRSPSLLSVYTYDKKWQNFSFSPVAANELTTFVVIDNQGVKWLVLPRGRGILVFNDNGTVLDKTDDAFKVLNGAAGNGGLPSADVYSIAKDNDGEIWVGTAEGIAIFYSPSSVFTDGVNFDAQRVIVNVNGYFEYLLGTETVTAIAVDGANRKWVGTKGSGVFLLSAEGTEELHHFTKDNSPLISNFIRTIKINETTGEVLFGTDDGIIAYKGTATGTEAQFGETYAYPNPVPEGYTGMIAVKGVAMNAQVRITDIAGNLVFETIAEGSQVVWNGKDMNGNRVATGIYLVMAIDTEGAESQVAKIMFTR